MGYLLHTFTLIKAMMVTDDFGTISMTLACIAGKRLVSNEKPIERDSCLRLFYILHIWPLQSLNIPSLHLSRSLSLPSPPSLASSSSTNIPFPISWPCRPETLSTRPPLISLVSNVSGIKAGTEQTTGSTGLGGSGGNGSSGSGGGKK